MINPFREVNWKPDLAARRQFAKSLLIGFPVIAVVLLFLGWLRTGHWEAHLILALWLACAGAGAGLLFYAWPQISRPFYVAWYFLACCIGIVLANLLLAAFFYLVITAFGLAMRLAGRRAFSKKFNRAADTYWREAPAPPPPSRYFKQF